MAGAATGSPTNPAESARPVCSQEEYSARELARWANPSAQFAPPESERAPALAGRAVAATEMVAPPAEPVSFARPSTDHPFQSYGADPFPQPSPRREEGRVRGPPLASFPVALPGLEEQMARLPRVARLRVAKGSPARAHGGGRGGPPVMAGKSPPVAAAPGVVASGEAAPHPRRPRRRSEKPAHPPVPAAAHDDSTLSAGARCFGSAI